MGKRKKNARAEFIFKSKSKKKSKIPLIHIEDSKEKPLSYQIHLILSPVSNL